MLKFKERKDDKMRYDAAEERWMSMENKGIKGYFTYTRIERDTGYIESAKEWSWLDEKSMTLEEVMKYGDNYE